MEAEKKVPYHYYAKTFHTLMVGGGAIAMFIAPIVAPIHPEFGAALGGIGGLLGGGAVLPDLTDKVTKWMTINGTALATASPAVLALLPAGKWSAIVAAILASLGGLAVGGARIPQPGSRPATRPSMVPPGAPDPGPTP